MTAHANLQDQRVYRITLQGQIDEEFVDAYCPTGTVLVREGDAAVLSAIHADQSAIVGLVRHLHSLGYSLLALEADRNQEVTPDHADY
jgi:hypothetical protein